MTPRLTAQLWVNALIRRVNAAGGFATVIAKGDAVAGGVILLLVSHDRPTRVLQRVSAADGGFVWQQALSVSNQCTTDIEEYLARQHRRDPDLWILELDIPSPERFIDEPILAG